MVLGSEVFLNGNITQNTDVGARSARALEKSLGFGAGRLAAGWAVLVLKQTLLPGDFQLEGLTLRSGGRLGLPADTPAADQARRKVHDQIMEEYGVEGYRNLQQFGLAGVAEKGQTRLVKVVPVTSPGADVVPSVDYPMGRGGLQWRLIGACKFLVAMTVDANEIAKIAGFSAYLGASAMYDDRARFARYLDTV